MIISFDLDDTIIPGTKQFDTMPRSLLQKFCGVEKIRTGTVELMKTLQGNGHIIYVYTTSLRPASRIWWTFFSYGIRLDRVINQKAHVSTLRERHSNYSKYPPAFNIDVHIDDSMGVEAEGNRFNFKTIIVNEGNSDWTDFVLLKVNLHSSISK